MNFIKKLLIPLMIALLICSLAGCASNSEDFEPDLSNLPEIEGVDFEEEIEDFSEDSFNVINLDDGEKETPYSANTVLFRGGECYTSDKSVATVSSKGVITAKGKGTCYIALVGLDIHGEPEVELFKVVVDAPAGMVLGGSFSNLPKETRTFMTLALTIGGVFFIGVVVAIIVIVTKVRKANKTEVPIFTIPQNQAPGFDTTNGFNNVNPTPPANDPTPGTVCRNCGVKVEGAFCPYCGMKLN